MYIPGNSTSWPGSFPDNTEKETFSQDPIDEILDYLNALTGRKFRSSTATHRKLLDRLLEEGHTIDQIKAVIAHKAYEWGNNPTMASYLRPITLFDYSNFNRYIGDVGK